MQSRQVSHPAAPSCSRGGSRTHPCRCAALAGRAPQQPSPPSCDQAQDLQMRAGGSTSRRLRRRVPFLACAPSQRPRQCDVPQGPFLCIRPVSPTFLSRGRAFGSNERTRSREGSRKAWVATRQCGHAAVRSPRSRRAGLSESKRTSAGRRIHPGEQQTLHTSDVSFGLSNVHDNCPNVHSYTPISDASQGGGRGAKKKEKEKRARALGRTSVTVTKRGPEKAGAGGQEEGTEAVESAKQCNGARRAGNASETESGRWGRWEEKKGREGREEEEGWALGSCREGQGGGGGQKGGAKGETGTAIPEAQKGKRRSWVAERTGKGEAKGCRGSVPSADDPRAEGGRGEEGRRSASRAWEEFGEEGEGKGSRGRCGRPGGGWGKKSTAERRQSGSGRRKRRQRPSVRNPRWSGTGQGCGRPSAGPMILRGRGRGVRGGIGRVEAGVSRAAFRSRAVCAVGGENE